MKKDARTFNLYFIIRSTISATIGFIIFSLIAWSLGTLTYLQAILASLASFLIPLFVLNVFHEYFQIIVKDCFVFLKRHKKLERFILKIIR